MDSKNDNTKLLNLYAHQVDVSNWADFETLFESKGSPSFCWCTVWRLSTKERKIVNKKEYMKGLVNSGIPIGILAYSNDKPIGWCSVAPRNTFLNLNGNQAIENVWSITCFFIKREYRQNGVQSFLLSQAIKYARDNMAQYVEAYPVQQNSPSYRFMGYMDLFLKNGFIYIKKAGSRRNVMNIVVEK